LTISPGSSLSRCAVRRMNYFVLTLPVVRLRSWWCSLNDERSKPSPCSLFQTPTLRASSETSCDELGRCQPAKNWFTLWRTFSPFVRELDVRWLSLAVIKYDKTMRLCVSLHATRKREPRSEKMQEKIFYSETPLNPLIKGLSKPPYPLLTKKPPYLRSLKNPSLVFHYDQLLSAWFGFEH